MTATKIMNIEDFNAYEYTESLKKKYGAKACNHYKRCMFELNEQMKNSSLLSELDKPVHTLLRMMVALDGTPTLLTCTTDNMNIYAYSVHNYTWQKELIADTDDFKTWIEEQ